ncbi:MAG: PKD domain-containing protein [Bacteroidota bacterium]|nr:PKD domain-containing protein [Bacteroidota bacterium]
MKFLWTLIFSVFITGAFGQEQWIRKADIGGDKRLGSIGFTIGDKGYIGLGFTSEDQYCNFDLWKYDPHSDSWTQMADFIGDGTYEASSFSIGKHAFVGLGYYGCNLVNDDTKFWRYDSEENSWSQKSDFPGKGRGYATGFSIEDKGYFTCGRETNEFPFKDLWEYKPSEDKWTQKSSLPSHERENPSAFVIGNLAYVGGGNTLYSGAVDIWSKEFFKYDPSNDNWTRVEDFPGQGRGDAASFSIEGKGYYGLGTKYGGAPYFSDFWVYEPDSDKWKKVADFEGNKRFTILSFSIISKGYIFRGNFVGDVIKNDFWEFTPTSVTADFSFENKCKNEEVKFTDESKTTGGSTLVSWKWFFGDGDSASTQNPKHVYTSSGTFSVKLVVTDDDNNTDEIEKTITIFEIPEANFSYSKNNFTVEFTNESQDGDAFFWDFGDGNTSEEENPEHTYNEAGDYKVKLIAKSICGEDEISQTIKVRCQMPEANFSVSIDLLDVQFNNITENADSYKWDFGDGNTSEEENPEHTYSDAGTFTVTLTVENSCGESIKTKVLNLSCPSPDADFGYSISGLTIEFNNRSERAGEYKWDFGDGNFSEESDPTYTYSNPGIYTVELIVINDCGEDRHKREIEIEPVGISETEVSGFGMKLFPNPAKNSVKIEFKKDIQQGENLSIYSYDGKLIKTFSAVNAGTFIEADISGFLPGIYLFILSSEKEIRASEKLIIK